MLFSTPFIRAVREKYPESFLACLVVPRCAPILENNPRLNEVIIFDEAGIHKGLLGRLKLICFLRSKHFDTAFLLHRSLTRTLICWLAGIPERVGYYTKKRKNLLTKSIIPAQDELHKVEYFLNIVKPLGIETKNKDYEFFPSQEDKDYINNLFQENGLKDNDFLVAINPGGNWELKRWSKQKFAKVSDRLIKNCQAKIIITGAKSDLKLARGIAAQMDNHPVILCGRTTLGQLAALMARVNLVISNDSGPMHIAVSQKTKVVALFGPTSPRITGPYGRGNYTVIKKDIGCTIPCYRLNCNDRRCMEAITVEDVFEAVNRFFANLAGRG